MNNHNMTKEDYQFEYAMKTRILPNVEYVNQRILTSISLCYILLNRKELEPLYFKKTKILVVNNVEFLWVLNQLGVVMSRVWYSTDSKIKADFAETLFPTVNIIRENILEWKTVMDFDVIVGNPPYTRTLYQKFMNKSLDLLKSNGYLAFVTPRGWLGNNTSGGNNFESFYIYNMELLHVWSKKFQLKYFKDLDGNPIGTGICWFIIQKKQKSKSVKIIYDEQPEENFFEIKSDGRGFPDVVNDITLKIHQQICKYKPLIPGSPIVIGKREDINDNTLLTAGRIKDDISTSHCYKHYTSHAKIRYANFKQSEFDDVRLCWYVQQRLMDAFVIEKSNTGQDIYRVTCKNNQEAENLKRIVNSKFYQYLDKFYGNYGRAPFREIRRILPHIDYSRTYTDAEIYQYFGLTADMIKYIKDNI